MLPVSESGVWYFPAITEEECSEFAFTDRRKVRTVPVGASPQEGNIVACVACDATPDQGTLLQEKEEREEVATQHDIPALLENATQSM